MNNNRIIKKKINGFTFIELLSVIIILGILMMVAIPAVTRYMNTSKKKVFIKTINSLVDTVKYGIITDDSNYTMKNNEEREFLLNTINLDRGKNPIKNGILTVIRTNDVYIYKIRITSSINNYCIPYTDVEKLNEEKIIECTNNEYKIGDKVNVEGNNWYVIENSSFNDDNIKLLKENPLTTDEVNEYGYSIINQYTDNPNGESYNSNGYGAIAYYSAYGCGGSEKARWSNINCKNNYNDSNVKEVLNNWASNSLKKIENSLIEIRLITLNELINLGCTNTSCSSSPNKWLYSNQYKYWTMTPGTDERIEILVLQSEWIRSYTVCVEGNKQSVIRPVINVSKNCIH